MWHLMVVELFSEVKHYIYARIANEIERKYGKMAKFDARMIGIWVINFFLFNICAENSY